MSFYGTIESFSRTKNFCCWITSIIRTSVDKRCFSNGHHLNECYQIRGMQWNCHTHRNITSRSNAIWFSMKSIRPDDILFIQYQFCLINLIKHQQSKNPFVISTYDLSTHHTLITSTLEENVGLCGSSTVNLKLTVFVR